MNVIPNYVLYGDDEKELFTNYLHIESIRARSRIHGWKFRPHQHHNLHQFFYILKGGGHVVIDGKEHPLGENTIVGIPPLTAHGFKFLPGTEGWVLSIPDLYLHNVLKDDILLLEQINQTMTFHCEGSSSQRDIQYIFNAINLEHHKYELTSVLTLRCLAALLVTKIAKLCPQVTPLKNEIASQKQIILRNFQHSINTKFKERLSVAVYAKILNITPTHLNRICRMTLNISALELIHERSLLEAKRLLIYTSMSIAEISYELGFCDPAHFSKFFHNKHGEKPSSYRQQF